MPTRRGARSSRRFARRDPKGKGEILGAQSGRFSRSHTRGGAKQVPRSGHPHRCDCSCDLRHYTPLITHQLRPLYICVYEDAAHEHGTRASGLSARRVVSV
eukprot:6703218-Prymnesium_polylepis.1